MGDTETGIAQAQAQDEKRNPERRREGIAKRRTSRGALPADLPRVEMTLTPKDTSCPCCRAAMTEIGCEESAEVIPSKRKTKIQIPNDARAYKLRNRIERFFNTLKHFLRIATRYDRRAAYFQVAIQLASSMVWMR